MQLLWRVLAILGTFVLAGLLTARALVSHAVAQGTPEYNVRLAGAMGGLFVGGVAASLVALIVLLAGHKRREDTREE